MPISRDFRRAVEMAVLAMATSQTWNPIVWQNASVARTVNLAKYSRLGDWVLAVFAVTITGSGNAGQPIQILSLPVNIDVNFQSYSAMGVAMIEDSGVGRYIAAIRGSSPNAIAFIDTVTRTEIGVNPNFALANNDWLRGTLLYKTL